MEPPVGEAPDRLEGAFDDLPVRVGIGSAWTTDAPYRETAVAIAAAEAEGIACVEMEAAGLYAYAQAAGVPSSHHQHHGDRGGDDFERGLDNGVHNAVVRAVASALL